MKTNGWRDYEIASAERKIDFRNIMDLITRLCSSSKIVSEEDGKKDPFDDVMS